MFRRDTSFQISLNQLEDTLTSVNSSYIVLRRDDTLTFITYVPYRANESERAWFLENKHLFLHDLGKEYFVAPIICKEIGEITDIRSWEERDIEQHSENAVVDHTSGHGANEMTEDVQGGPLNAGYKKNKCRLCDRRMKNKMFPEASAALGQLHTPGAAVQLVRFPRLSPSPIIYSHILVHQNVNKHPRSQICQEPGHSRRIRNLAH